MKLTEFFDELDTHEEQIPIDELAELMERVQISRADYGHCVAFAQDRYKRNVIRVGSGYAALILCWQPRQASPIHDHHGSACGVRVLEGAVTEVKYARSADGKLTESGTKRYEVGRVCGSFDTDIHTIQNREKTNLVTLHIYTPPMTRYRVYSLSRAEPEWFRDVETLEAQRALAAQRA